MLESMVYIALLIGIICGAIQAIRAHHLLTSALCLAAVSAQLAVLLFLLGAPEVAVIELSVGAGLVTVLFVFAITVAGQWTQDLPTVVPRPLAWSLIVLIIALSGWFIFPVPAAPPAAANPSFSQLLWQERAMDVWVQIALIFAGVLGLLSLLAEEAVPVRKPVANRAPKARAAFRPEILQPQPVTEEVHDVVAH